MAETPSERGTGIDPRHSVDALLNTPERAGLTGTAPAGIYTPLAISDRMTIAPDGRPAEQQPAWRRDFPIDWPQDQYVARRDFMKFMVLTSLAFTVGQLWIGLRHWWRERRSVPASGIRVATLSDVPVGRALVFQFPGEQDPYLLIRPSMDRVVAYSQTCTHLACAVVPRLEEGTIFCPCHHGYFDLESGRPIAGPPRRPLPRVQLEVRGNDVWATRVEIRAV
jgi:Rieske Fe-S protein